MAMISPLNWIGAFILVLLSFLLILVLNWWKMN